MTHLELVGLSATSDLIGLLRDFKGTATAQARNMGISNLWEKSYHDHGLRADDNHNAVARAAPGFRRGEVTRRYMPIRTARITSSVTSRQVL